MKKNWIWSVAAVATLLAVSCQHDDANDTINPTEGKTHSFIIKASRSIENEAEATRITFSDAEGAQWAIGDQIHAVPMVTGAASSVAASSSALQEGEMSDDTATFTFDELADGTYRFFYPQPTSFPKIGSKYTVRYYCPHEQTQSQAGAWGNADGLIFASDPIELSEETPISTLKMKLSSAALKFHVYGSTYTDEYVESITIPGIESGVRDQLCLYTEGEGGLTANGTTALGTTVTLGTPYNVPQFTDKAQCENDGIYMWMVRTSNAVGISFVVNTNKGAYIFTPESGYQFKVGLTNIYLNLSNNKAIFKPTINVEIAIPDFSESSVYKVMVGEDQVAQIAKEFLYKEGVVNEQAIVVYPVNTTGAVELGKGFVAQVTKIGDSTTATTETTYEEPTEDIHGGSVAFSISGNSISSYTAGTEGAFSTVYLAADGTIGGTALAGSITATVEPEVLVDNRGDKETYTYPIAKIATQYWMAESLRTRYYNSNKSFATITTGVGSDYNLKPWVMVDGAKNVNNVPGNETLEQNRDTYGYLYSFLAISGDKLADAEATTVDAYIAPKGALTDNLAPAGWTVPTYIENDAKTHYQALVNYIPCSYLLGNYELEKKTGYETVASNSMNNLTGFNGRRYRTANKGSLGYGNTFYAVYMSRSRSNQTAAQFMMLLLYDDNSKPYRNRWDFNRNAAIRCVNDGAIKITE